MDEVETVAEAPAAEAAAPVQETAANEEVTTTPEAQATETEVTSEDSYTFPGTKEEADAEIRRLRDENAARRVANKSVEEAFDGWEDEEREAWLELARSYRNDPASVKDVFSQLAESIAELTGEDVEVVEEALNDAAEGSVSEDETAQAEAPLTESRLNEILSEKAQKEATARELAKIETETAELGLEPGTVAYDSVLQIALDKTNGNIAEAHKVFEGYVQERVDSALASLRADMNTTPPVADGGSSFSVVEPPKTLKEARQRAAAFLSGEKNATV